MSYVKILKRKNLINPPKFVSEGLQYEVITGSFSYGCSDDLSDIDLYGFCIPPKDVIFPHLRGEIQGFGKQTQQFNNYQEHHIKDTDANQEYDVDIYNIIKYFQLVMLNNPNMIDSLFVPQRCVTHCTQVGNIVRENRKLFLHKGSFHKLKGYAYSQIHKIKNKKPIGKRLELIKKFGFDTKFASHTVRLLNQAEQILTEGDLNLERNREQLKAIRRGEWTEEQIIEYFETKERELEGVYSRSTLPHSPDEAVIKQILLNCLEQHFGTLDKMVHIQPKTEQIINELKLIVDKYDRV